MRPLARPLRLGTRLLAVGLGALLLLDLPAGPGPASSGPKGAYRTTLLAANGGEGSAAFPGQPARPPLRARAALLVDLGSGRVLLARRAGLPLPVASLTKIMTALLVLERSSPSDVARVSARAARQPPTTVGLVAGERISVKDLLYGLLLSSGNDAAVALAERVSGSVPSFVESMNRRAAELGMGGTDFASPSGLNDRGRSTAEDLARLTEVALREPWFARIVATERRTIRGSGGVLERVRNLNKMLWAWPGTFGVKTGYTRRAGECLITAVRSGGRRLLAVVLGEPVTAAWKTAYTDAVRMIRYGFAMLARTSLRVRAR